MMNLYVYVMGMCRILICTWSCKIDILFISKGVIFFLGVDSCYNWVKYWASIRYVSNLEFGCGIVHSSGKPHAGPKML